MSKDVKFGISLYSWADSFSHKGMTMDGMLKASREIGYTGISIVAAQHAEEYPNISDKWLYNFRDLMAKHNLDPVMWEGYIDMGMRHDRDLNEEEIMEFTFNDMLYAKKAGFSQMKTQHSISPATLVKMLPICRDLDMKLTIEMHYPHHMNVPIWHEYIAAFTDPKNDGYLGVVPDFSVWQFTPHTLHIRQGIDEGARPDIFAEIIRLMREGKGEEEIFSTVPGMSAVERKYTEEFCHKFGHPAPLSDLKELLKYTTCIHGKYYYIDETGIDPSISFADLMPIIRESDYDGYVLSEYEGHHYYIDGIDDYEQNRLGYELMKKSFE